jgi:PAS domain S-box-containing protein
MECPTYLLLIDDNVSDRTKIRQALDQTAEPYTMLEAKDRTGVVAILSASHSLHLILSDGHLPRLSCKDVLELLEEHRPLVPLLLILSSKDPKPATTGFPRETSCYAFQCALEQVPIAARVLVETTRRIQAGLQNSEARFSQVAQSISDWIWETNADGRYTYASPAIESVTGYKPQEIVGERIHEFFALAEPTPSQKTLLETLKRQEAFSGLGHHVVHKSGHRVLLNSSATPILSQDKRFLGYRGVSRDVTAQMRHEQTLRVINDASLAAQQARTPDDVYDVITEKMNLLDYRSFILSLSRDKKHLQIQRLAISENLLSRVQHLTGLQAASYQIPVESLPDYEQILDKQEVVFAPDLALIVTRAVPITTRPVAQKIATMLGLHQGVLAPLVVSGQAQGVLIVSANTLNEVDVPAVTAFADQMSAALERAHLFAELQEREWRATVAYEIAQEYADELEEIVEIEQAQLREISILHQIAAVTTEQLTTQAVMERGLTAIAELFQLDGAAIYFVDTGMHVHVAFALGIPEPLLEKLQLDPPRLSDLYVGPAILKGEPVLIQDLENMDLAIGDGARQIGVHTVANLPLRAGGRLIGVMALHAFRPQALTENDLPLLNNIAAQFAATLEHAQLFEQEQQHRVELDYLNNALRLFADQLQECYNEKAVAHLLCEITCSTLGWQKAVVLLRNYETMTSRPVAQTGYHGEAAEQLMSLPPIPFKDVPPPQQDLYTSHSYYIPDISSHPEAHQQEWFLPPLESDRVPYFLVIPLEAGGRVLGNLLPTGWEDGKLPTRRQIEHLELLAAQAAIAIESIRLSKLAQMWADAVQHSGDAIIITDIDGRILSANRAFETLTGYQPREAIGQTPRILKSRLTPSAVYEEMWATILARNIWRGEVINRRRDGSIYDADLTIAPILDTRGDIIGFVGSQRDISRIKELDRLKTQFVSNVSHELRTPLTNIKLYQRYLRENRRPDLHDQFFNILERETNRLGQIVEEVLDLSQLESGIMPPRRESFDLNELVEEIVAEYYARAREKELNLTLEQANKVLPVAADRGQLAQALANLVINALNYTPAGGSISVTTYATESTAAVDIRDTGHGIAPEEQGQIFDRFFRGKLSRRTDIPGTGLGLAIVKQIVELHGGMIRVKSEVGEGSTFTIMLPISEESTSVSGTILLLKDTTSEWTTIERKLAETGYRVISVPSLEDALVQLAEEMPDLIVLDLPLGGMNASHILPEMHSIDVFSSLPLLVLTAADPTWDHQATIEANEFLTKPYSERTLLDVVRRLLSSRDPAMR